MTTEQTGRCSHLWRAVNDTASQCAKCGEVSPARASVDTDSPPAPGVLMSKHSHKWKCGDEFLPYHPSASHVTPEYRDGWNACYEAARRALAAPVEPQSPGVPRENAFANHESDLVSWMESVIKDLGGSIYWDDDNQRIVAQIRYDFTDIGYGQTLAEVRANALGIDARPQEGAPGGQGEK